MIKKGTRVGHSAVLNFGTVVELLDDSTRARVRWDSHGRESLEATKELFVLENQTEHWTGRTIQ